MGQPTSDGSYLGLAIAVWTGLGAVVHVFARIALRGFRPPWRKPPRPHPW